MTTIHDSPQREKKIVVFCDMCSSTAILEDLLATENDHLWRNLLIKLKTFLRAQRDEEGFEIYKFIGDGWVLLFDIDTHPDSLFGVMRELCKQYQAIYKRTIHDVLTSDIPSLGIAFGIDRGTLVRVVMNSTIEYIGRPLNVAARLQTTIKDKDAQPGGKVLISPNAFAPMRESIQGRYHVDDVRRRLRNLAGGAEYRCKKVWLFRK